MDADPADPKIDNALKHNQKILQKELKKYGFTYASSIYWANLKEVYCTALNYHNIDWTVKGALDFIEETVVNAGPNPCPPLVVGVGIGGTFERAAYMAKRSLLRPVGESAGREDVAKLEEELLARINRKGRGVHGLGGSNTALAVHIETYPTHIASLPVAVNIQCHSHRHKEIVL